MHDCGKLCEENQQLQEKLKASEEYINELYYYDSLTKLPNLKKLHKRLKNSTAEEKTVVMLDIDRFHSINVLYGREYGDLLIIELAERLKEVYGNIGTVFRQECDEFYLFIEGVPFESLEIVGQQLIEIISNPFEIRDRIIHITASVGISHCPDNQTATEELVHQAEVAKFQTKRSGQNNFLVYLPEDKEIIARNRAIEMSINKAIQNNEFYLVYQPKMNLATGEIAAVEALMRWEHPILGNIPPFEFIPIAEQSGVMTDLGYWVIYEAARQLREWKDGGIELMVAVNVSATQFQDQWLVDRIVDSIALFDLDPAKFIIEITESVMSNPEYAKRVSDALHSHGIKVAIDDFGTGYSSLSLLSNMPIDILKIDRSFIQGVPGIQKTDSLVRSMIQMGRNLGFQVIAEGIETIEQQDFLVENDCPYGQGYLYSRPVLPDDIVSLVEQAK